MRTEKLTPAIGAILHGADLDDADAIYQALLDNLVIFIRGAEIDPARHLAFARSFGQIDDPHPLYPHVEGYDHIMLLENDSGAPPDTNSWHTDLSYKGEQPFASVLIARAVPEVGGSSRAVVVDHRVRNEGAVLGWFGPVFGIDSRTVIGVFSRRETKDFAVEGERPVLPGVRRYR